MENDNLVASDMVHSFPMYNPSPLLTCPTQPWYHRPCSASLDFLSGPLWVHRLADELPLLFGMLLVMLVLL